MFFYLTTGFAKNNVFKKLEHEHYNFTKQNVGVLKEKRNTVQYSLLNVMPSVLIVLGISKFTPFRYCWP